MPDLEQRAVIKWLGESIPAGAVTTWPPAIRPVETTEEAVALLEELGTLLDEIRALDISALSAELQSDSVCDNLRAILAQTGTARTLRFLHWLSEQEIPTRSAIAATLTGGDSACARALRAAIAAAIRSATLKRTLAPDRIITLHSAAEIAMKEPA